jgi:hypothetical protein
MGTEENGNRKKRTITCGWCDGITEMIRDCFPDEAGYSACLAMMNGNRGKIFGQKTGEAAKEGNRGCCG